MGEGWIRPAYIDLLSASKLSTTHFEAALDASVEFPEHGSAAVAALRLSIGTGALLQAALLPGAVVAVGTEHVGGGVAHVGLAEACDKVCGGQFGVLDGLLQHPGRDALVVGGGVRVVPEEGGAVDREPCQDTHALVVRGPPEAEQGHGRVRLGVVLVALCLRIG